MSTLEKNWWARVHHYSHLYDFDDSGSQIRTPSQKFIFMGKSAAIRLVKMNLLADEEAETFSSSVLTSITPGTLNGAAFALVYTTYDPYTHTFLQDVDPKATGEIKAYQKKRCWSTLVKNLKSEELKSFVHDYGITGPDLLRYFLYMKNKVQPKLSSSLPTMEQEEKQETFY